jgi:CO dehydrogenase maturation factor
MKIAFVGKGGAGKSTLAALFISHLRTRGRAVLAIDGDINMNLGGLLGVACPSEKLLSTPVAGQRVREFLRGTNSRIADAASFLPTTLPGSGSNWVTRHDQPELSLYAVDIDPKTRLITVGTYEETGIGQTCYHSHLFVAENLLSHTRAAQFDVVCDMVAGTDSFAYSMYLQFDVIVLVAEPTPESTEVCNLYLHLADRGGIRKLVYLIGNKVEDEEDQAFIENATGTRLLGVIPRIGNLKKIRQDGRPLDTRFLDEEQRDCLRRIKELGRTPPLSDSQRYQMLNELHLRLSQKEWVKKGYGDVTEQNDEELFKTMEGV